MLNIARTSLTKRALSRLPLPAVTLTKSASPCLIRFQGTIIPQQPSSEPLTDEQVDEWLTAIHDLKEQFQQQGFDPETSLASPGQPRVNFAHEQQKQATFKPTEEQILQWETLKDVPIPAKFDPILKHVTNMIMRDGKREKAERILSRALYLVHCQTRSDPIKILKDNLDQLSPLMITKTFKTGVAKASFHDSCAFE